MSDYGSDQNDCQTESAPCKNLQTVLDRASDGADIYVTSDTLSLDGNLGRVDILRQMALNSAIAYNRTSCKVYSTISYSISSLSRKGTNILCPDTG